MERLIKGLHEFQTKYFNTHQEMFARLSLGQHPRALFITCSDSRINPHLITQTEPGELFIMRNVGNIIPPYGATNGGEAAAIEYAIHALEVTNIIVCGHSDCGAMKGLLQLGQLAEEMPLVYEWLKQAEATRRVIKDNYPKHSGDSLISVTIQENVLTQIENLRTYPVIRAKLRAGKLHIHAWVYNIQTGEVFAYSPVKEQFVLLESQFISSLDCGHADLMAEHTEFMNSSDLEEQDLLKSLC
ncbi:MAG TPA: carbonic anhydrase [Halomicronema sp.]